MSSLPLSPLKNQFTNTLLLGDSVIAGLSRYLKVSQKYFTPLTALKLELEKTEWKMYFGETRIY